MPVIGPVSLILILLNFVPTVGLLAYTHCWYLVGVQHFGLYTMVSHFVPTKIEGKSPDESHQDQ